MAQPRLWLMILLSCLLAQAAHADHHAVHAAHHEDAAEHAEAHADDGHDHGHEKHIHGSKHDHHDEIVVTITGRDRQRFDVIQGSSVLTGDELFQSQAPTLGDIVSRVPGTRSTGYTQGSTRPVIRGLDGPRVRTLQNGVGNIDVSVTSPDHVVVTEPLLAERIEVIRGAGTLRYGSNAVGGVVNVIDGVIPESIPDGGVSGAFRSTYGTNADDRTAAGALRAGTGNVAVQVQGSIRRTNDLEVRGDPLSSEARLGAEDDPFAMVSGRVPASDVESQNGDIGVSAIFDQGFFGIGYSRFDSDYGLPVAEEEEEEEGGEEEEEEGEEEIRLDAESDRYHAAGEWNAALGPFDQVAFRGVYGDYEHVELEGGEVGTRFTNDGFEGRVELRQATAGVLDGLIGAQLRTRDLEAVGAEAFLPQSDTRQWALFIVEELDLDPFRIEAGIRYENTDLDVSNGLRDRQFHSFSGSLGGALEIGERTLVGMSVSLTERPPVAEELYSDGPHLATSTFEIGDDSLDEEFAASIELTAKYRGERTRAGLNLFYTSFDDFIFQADTGEIEDGLPVRVYSQSDADFFGAELELAHDVFVQDDVTATVDFLADWVRGRRNSGVNLPRIPPLRLRLGLEGRSRLVDGRLELEWVDAQTRTAPFETSTDDFFLVNASVTVRPIERLPELSLLVQGRNLLDARGRNHVSFLKERVPIAGRDVRFGVEWRF